MKFKQNGLIQLSSWIKSFVYGFVLYFSPAAQSQHIDKEKNNFSKKDIEKSVENQNNKQVNQYQLVSAHQQKVSDANQCVIKLDELNASVVRLKKRRLMLSEKAENSRKMLQTVDLEIVQLEQEIRYWNKMLLSIKSAENQQVPKPIYDGSLADDERKRESLKESYYASRPKQAQKIVLSRTRLESLPKQKQEAIVRDTLQYKIVE
jgi:hypothetical protein